jgi:Rieske Fe-S protein
VTGNQEGNRGDTGGGRYVGPRAHDPVEEHDPHDDPAFVTRTKFLTGVAIATGGVMTAAILVPVVGFAVADSVAKETWDWVDVGSMSQFPIGETSSIALSAQDPEADRRVFIRREPDDLIPMWNRCTHLGCPVTTAGAGFACPCHGGAFDPIGQVTAGPPARPLDRFDWKVVRPPNGSEVAARESRAKLRDVQDDDRLLIGRAYSLDEDLAIYELKGPGQPATGVLSNLYPF